jgi:hypothetical protein
MTEKQEKPLATETFVLYQATFKGLFLELESGRKLDMSFALKNGRSSYLIFEHLVSLLSGLESNSQGGDADLASAQGLKYEVKAYKEPEIYPHTRDDYFHTGASSTFGPNNIGQTIINPALKRAKLNPETFAIEYATALEACMSAGYAHNDYYVYTNTAQYELGTPFRYIIIPTAKVLENLSNLDPRLISRVDILAMAKRKEILEF